MFGRTIGAAVGELDGMILIDVALTTNEAHRTAFLDLLRDTVTGSLEEEGCVTYRATVALDDPLRFHLLELWEDEPAYLAHSKGPILARFLRQLPNCGNVLSIERRQGALAPYPAART